MTAGTNAGFLRNALVSLALGCACAPVWAVDLVTVKNLAIQNPGFEAPVVGADQDFVASPGTGWTSAGSPALHRKAAYKLPPEQSAAVEGGQFLNARGATVSQTLAVTYTAGQQYTLTCLVGKTAPNMWPCTGYAVQLKRGDVIMAEVATKTMSATGTAPPPSDTMLDLVTVKYAAVAADQGQPITIALSGQGAALFDDVKLAERKASGEATVSIPIAANGHVEQAYVLRRYLLESTPCDVNVVETSAELPASGLGIVLNIQDEIPGLSARPTALQGYRIVARGNRVTLSARTARGLTYAVSGLLEDHLGVRFFAPDCQVVQKRATFALPDFEEVREPAIQVRSMFGFGGTWEIRNRGGGLPADILVASHNFYAYAPPDKYLQSHPEWYLLLDGKRQQHWLHGLCYSNPDLARQMASNIVAEIRAYKLPSEVPIKIGQGDGFIACGCEVCRKVANDNASEAGPVILLLNRVLDAMHAEFPQHQLITFAYGDTIRMPKAIKPNANLWINIVSSSIGGGGWGIGQGGDMVGTIRRNRHNAVYQEAIEQWTKAAPGRVAIWNWSTGFIDHSVEWPNLFTMVDNIRFWREQGVAAVALQTTGGEGNWGWLKHWVWLKLMWNPDADVNALVREFLVGYYGPKAAPILWEYLQYVEQVRSKSDFTANACDGGQANAMAMLKGLFPTPTLDRMDALLEQATLVAAAEKDPVYAQRVQHARAYSVDQLKIVATAGVQPHPGGHFYPPEKVALFRVQDPRDGSFWMVPGTTPDMPARVERRDESLKFGGDREWGAGFINRFWYQRGVGGRLTRIESRDLAVEVCPNLVGTITSLIHKPTGKELLAGRFPLYEWHVGMQSMECFLPEIAPRRLVMEQWIQTDVWYYQENRLRYRRTLELGADDATLHIGRAFTDDRPGNAGGMPDPAVFPSIWTFQVPELAAASMTVTVRGERKVIPVREKGVTELPVTRPGDAPSGDTAGDVIVELDRGDGLLVTLTTPAAGWAGVKLTSDPDNKAVSVALSGISLKMTREGNRYNLPGVVLKIRKITKGEE